jgi:hypothetical protein
MVAMLYLKGSNWTYCHNQDNVWYLNPIPIQVERNKQWVPRWTSGPNLYF